MTHERSVVGVPLTTLLNSFGTATKTRCPHCIYVTVEMAMCNLLSHADLVAVFALLLMPRIKLFEYLANESLAASCPTCPAESRCAGPAAAV